MQHGKQNQVRDEENLILLAILALVHQAEPWPYQLREPVNGLFC